HEFRAIRTRVALERTQEVDLLLELVECALSGRSARPVLECATHRSLSVSADQHRKRLLDGPGERRQVVDSHPFAFVRGDILFPEDSHRAQVLIRTPAAHGKKDAERLELAAEMAEADTEDDPTPGEPVDRRDLL